MSVSKGHRHEYQTCIDGCGETWCRKCKPKLGNVCRLCQDIRREETRAACDHENAVITSALTFEAGEFAFTLNVTPREGTILAEDLVELLFQDSIEVIAQVLADYNFEEFEAIRLIHPLTGRNLLLPKTQLEFFR